MDITSTQQDAVTVVAIAGSMDALTAPNLTDSLTKQIATGQVKLVVDMAKLDYTSSAGLRALLAAVKDARQHDGDVRLAAVLPNVYKVLEMSGFTSILKVFPSVDEAVKSYS